MTEQKPPQYEWDPPLPEHILTRVRALVGLDRPNQNDALHVRLVNTVVRTWAMSPGQQLSAVRFDFNWCLLEAGKRKSTLKADYDRLVDRETTRMVAAAEAENRKLSRREAEQRVTGTDEAYNLKLAQLLAEHEEQSMRKFLDTIDGAIETWRTDQANRRAADTAEARGFGGGS